MLNRKVKLGILLPTRALLISDDEPQNADLILDMAKIVEQAGLDSVWVGDSLTAKTSSRANYNFGSYSCSY